MPEKPGAQRFRIHQMTPSTTQKLAAAVTTYGSARRTAPPTPVTGKRSMASASAGGALTGADRAASAGRRASAGRGCGDAAAGTVRSRPCAGVGGATGGTVVSGRTRRLGHGTAATGAMSAPARQLAGQAVGELADQLAR